MISVLSPGSSWYGTITLTNHVVTFLFRITTELRTDLFSFSIQIDTLLLYPKQSSSLTKSLKHAFWLYFKRYGTPEKQMKTMSLKHAFWLYLKRFGTAEKQMKTMSLKHAFWLYLKRFGTAEKQMKTMSLNHAFWRIRNDSEPQKSFIK